MSRFMLLMRGSQKEFVNMSDVEKNIVIGEHVAWSQELRGKSILVDGNGFSNLTLKLIPDNGQILEQIQPYIETAEELSGYYIIETESMIEAVEISRSCPALRHGESVEVVPLGH